MLDEILASHHAGLFRTKPNKKNRTFELPAPPGELFRDAEHERYTRRIVVGTRVNVTLANPQMIEVRPDDDRLVALPAKEHPKVSATRAVWHRLFAWREPRAP
jgi:hypothetical protein